jgi:hypothetical protein
MTTHDDKPKKIRRRRTSATVGGTTQSGFASRSMSEQLKRQRSASQAQPKPRTGSQHESETD